MKAATGRMNIDEIVSQFATDGTVDDALSHGNGHIHDTYHVKTKENGAPDYLLQRINHLVFQDVDAMMGNIDLVTAFLRQSAPGRRSLNLVKTKRGQCYWSGQDQYWRVFEFLDGLISYDEVEDEGLVYEGGLILGDFLNGLSPLDPKLLQETIPNFHDLRSRLDSFESSVHQATTDLADQAKDEIKIVHGFTQLLDVQKMKEAGVLPIRVTHNDTKLNNVLYDPSGKAQCVIDLDTVMPGLVHYDFGDAIRTACATAAEDESDLQLVGINLDKLRAFSSGYLESTRDALTKQELHSLALAIPLMSFIMGVRFLTDFLQGDVYYKVHYPNQNLTRARAQLHLTEEAWRQLADLKELIRRV